MNNKYRALYDALTGIDPELIEEASQPVPRNRHLHKRMLRFVAAAAALSLLLLIPSLIPSNDDYITAPGMLIIRTYAVNSADEVDMDGTVMEAGIDFPYDHAWCSSLNIASGIPIHLSINDDNLDSTTVTWEITVKDGSFMKSDDGDFHPEGYANEDYLGQSFTVPNNTMLLWENIYYDPAYFSASPNTVPDSDLFTPYFGESTYVECVVRSDHHIIGYALIEICGLPNPLEEYNDGSIVCFSAKLIAANYYPKVNGVFQSITEDYVRQQMQAMKEQ